MDAVAIENGKPWVVMAESTLEDAQLMVVCRRWLTGDPQPWPGLGRDYWVGDRVPPVKPMKPRVFKEHGEWGEWVVLYEKTFAFHRTWREAIIHALALANREYYSNLGGPTP